MNGKILFLSTFCSTFLMVSTTAVSQNSVSINQNNSSSVSINQNNSSSVSINQGSGGGSSQSQISVSLASGNLGKPYNLRINAPKGTNLTGQITRNGRVIRQLKGGNQTSINLSPLLSKGRQTIRISGNYKPPQSSVRIQFSGPGTKLSQQTSGNGRLNQTLTINVR